jgi:hypothetical protein
MTSEQLGRLLEQRPFQPFVVRSADGRETRVSHPEAMGYQGRIATYIHPTGAVEILDLFLLSSIRVDVPAESDAPPPAPSAEGNGV